MKELIFVNNAAWQFSLGCIVELEGVNNPSTYLPLIWMSVKLDPGKVARFKWLEVFEFFWANTGLLQSGDVVVQAARQRADAAHGDMIQLTRRRGGGYRFDAVKAAPEAGMLQIRCDETIPANSVSVGLNIRIVDGVGTPGSGVVVQQAQQNISYTWKTEPKYSATFGHFVHGEYHPKEMQSPTPFSFPTNVNTMSVVLGEDNKLKVDPVTQTNKTFRLFGRVIGQATQQGIADLRVEAWDKDLIIDDLLGSVVTEADGTFQLSFDESYFQEIFFDRHPELYFKIYSQEDLIKSTESSVLWNVTEQESEIVIQVPRLGSST